MPILKPHGSLNWNRFRQLNWQTDYPYWVPIGRGSQFSFNFLDPFANPFEPPVNFNELHCNIFPGDADSPMANPSLALIWADAQTAINRSDSVIFIGYSLPEYDTFAGDFFNRLVRGKRIEVYNPSVADLEKYDKLFGYCAVREAVKFEQCPYARIP